MGHLVEPRWYLRVGPVEWPQTWRLVRAYMMWEHEVGGRAAAVRLGSDPAPTQSYVTEPERQGQLL